jgi:hypothetical protein
MSDEKVTLGEVHRICLDIKDAVREQNGRVRKLENDSIRIKAFWSVGVVTIGLFADSIKHKLGL